MEASSSRAHSRSTCSHWAFTPASRTLRTPSSSLRTARPSPSKTSPPFRREPKIRLGQIGRATHLPHGAIIDNPDTVEGIVLLQKGDDSDPVLQGIHEEVDKLNHGILPKGVKVVPFLDRSKLVSYTVETVERNLTEGMILVAIILFLFLGNVRGAIVVTLLSRLR